MDHVGQRREVNFGRDLTNPHGEHATELGSSLNTDSELRISTAQCIPHLVNIRSLNPRFVDNGTVVFYDTAQTLISDFRAETEERSSEIGSSFRFVAYEHATRASNVMRNFRESISDNEKR